MNLSTFEKDHYVLDECEERHEESPDNFYLPELSKRQNLEVGDLVKLIFRMEEKSEPKSLVVERMWVIVKDKIEEYFIGELDNDPYGNVFLSSKDQVVFQAKHVIQIYEG